jgi:hypothetical protein
MAVKPRKLRSESQADNIHAAIVVCEVNKSTFDVERAYRNQCMWYAEAVLNSWPEVLVDLLRQKKIQFFAIATNLVGFRFMSTQELPSTDSQWPWFTSGLIFNKQHIAKEILYICLAAVDMLEHAVRSGQHVPAITVMMLTSGSWIMVQMTVALWYDR